MSKCENNSTILEPATKVWKVCLIVLLLLCSIFAGDLFERYVSIGDAVGVFPVATDVPPKLVEQVVQKSAKCNAHDDRKYFNYKKGGLITVVHVEIDGETKDCRI